MQSGYGGVSEIHQQFMVDGIFPPQQNPNASSAAVAAAASANEIHHQHQKFYHYPQHPLPMPPPHHAQHYYPSTPITQQLFHHPHHQFQLFHPNPSSSMSFKLGVNDSEDDDHSWHREEESVASIKEPFWRPLDIDYINRNNKRAASPENNNNTTKKNKETAAANNESAAAASNNYKLFSELEAIYKPGSSGSTPNVNNVQTGSGSALTGEGLLPEPVPPCAAVAIDDEQPDHGSDTSDGADAAPPPPASPKGIFQSRRKLRAKRRQQEQMSTITSFFERLVKQVMDHQESLHCKFLEIMERRDKERTLREETWRKQEAARSVEKAASRAQERALAASREAAIVSFLEKLTGETLVLPTENPHKENECNVLELYNAADGGNNSSGGPLNTSRWPKTEVQALIRIRSGLETRFQEPGLKGPLWEEVSSTMASMGYQRSSKRCKEKWENINKYFRKTKDSGKKRPQHSKTCPYFHQLDQLYSKSSTPPSSSNAERKDNSELLDAIVVSNDHQSFKFPEIGNIDEQGEAGSKSNQNYGENDDNEDGEEGEGDSQEQQNVDDQNPNHDSSFFFQRLRS